MQLTTALPKKFRVPSEHGGFLAVPPLHTAPSLIAQNRAQQMESTATIAGKPIRELAESARRGLLQAAVEYTREYQEPPRAHTETAPIIMAGHQPELFHPGVWVKNFAADAVARQTDGVAVHMLVDNDVVAAPQIELPVWTQPHEGGQQQAHFQRRAIAIDSVLPAVPFEERSIADRPLFASAGERIASAIQPIVPDPIIRELWPAAVQASDRHGNLGRALAEARHQVEAKWGLSTLEIPLSRICTTFVFRLFAAEIFDRLDQFQKTYNASIIDYRQRNRLRSNSHPAPLLRRVGLAIETPFWIWSARQPQRQPLFICAGDDCRALLAGPGGAQLGALPPSDIEDTAEAVARLETDQGIKIRPRALMTTLYARLFLCDLFLHGIGGGKYDQVTDSIIGDFFASAAPEFMVVTATFRLPQDRLAIEADDVRQIDGMLRELRFHPEACGEQVAPADSSRFAQLVDAKHRLLSDIPGSGHRKAWHEELQRTNLAMAELLEPSRQLLHDERNRLVRRRLSDRIIASREFSFSLFPANSLRSALHELDQ